ncbi:MAG: CDP-diacylglycerol--glycerol-3-phosphate 3-phosphatidyltransferase [Deltaproteobacteria bacterium]|nr:CDP-diacylglycerol--glycerol-3-phosphate 3-phosphatidyltransferase [Deltaproteobacteria bacterium]
MWTLPNLISIARIATIPVIVTLIWPGIEGRETCFFAMVIYALGGLSDMFDGYLARRMHQVTVLGKFLDPLSDKLFYLVTMVALLQLHRPRVPPVVVMIVLTRELAITGLRGIAISEGIVIDANEGGKVKTTIGTIGMCALLLHYPYLINYGPFSTLVDFHIVGWWLTIIAVAVSVTSGAMYVRGFLTALAAHRRPS